MNSSNHNSSIDRSVFFKLRRLYLVAFLLIAMSIIVAQILIQRHLNGQLNDTRIVNIAGRQRMLSQKLVKEILYLSDDQTDNESQVSTIKQDLETFTLSHQSLQNDLDELGSITMKNPELVHEFAELETHYQTLVQECENVIEKVENNSEISIKNLSEHLRNLKENEDDFLTQMDHIVFKYDEISKKKLEDLKQKELILLLVSLLILLFEILFLFRPISIHIKKVISELIAAKQESQEKVNEIEDLYQLKEESLQELQGLNYAIDNAALFISISHDNSILHISKKFSNLLGLNSADLKEDLDKILSLEAAEEQTIYELLKGNRRSIWNGEFKVRSKDGNDLWLEMSIIPANQIQTKQKVLILCNDITERKRSQLKLNKINEERFLKEVNLQKEQASLIVEAQEKERKRIAKDIHDGIGQMLTALKFNIESINSDKVDSTKNKVEKLKELLGLLIKEVRSVTFSLTPPELTDYGIVPAINKLVGQLSKFTEKEIFFENKTNFKGRFNSLVEINLYRVVQEAVNNALKYANANYILISLSHSNDILSIVIDDDGKGFDYKNEKFEKEDSGMGLFFMKERINYIDGRIFINSEINKGTRITINLKLN